MIYYIVTKNNAYTLNYYVTSWGKSIVPHICTIFYENLTQMKRLLPGTYIFSDLERLTSEQAERRYGLDLANAKCLQSQGNTGRA